jgi:hypothetical protein
MTPAFLFVSAEAKALPSTKTTPPFSSMTGGPIFGVELDPGMDGPVEPDHDDVPGAVPARRLRRLQPAPA